MTEPKFLTEEGFLTIRALQRVRTLLMRDGQMYQKELWKRCGFRLTAVQFDAIIKELARSQWCSVSTGLLGATMVILSEEVRNAGKVYEVPGVGVGA